MKRFFHNLLSILLALFVLAASDTAQSKPVPVLGNWRVKSYESLLNKGIAIQKAFPAPDGKQIAYIKSEGLCSYNAFSAEDRCVSIPRELERMNSNRWLSPLAWSSDSERVALTGMPYHYLYDTDLTAITLSTGERHILAQDRYQYGLLSNDEQMRAPVFVDVSPVWSPDGKTIAVERSMVTKQDGLIAANLTLVDSLFGYSRKLADIPGHAEDQRDSGTTLSMIWSPDGSTIAAGFLHVQHNPAIDGIWLFDVESGAATQLVTMADAETAYHEIFPEAEVFTAIPLSWSPDGTRLLFALGNPGAYTAEIWCFWIDMLTRQITALPLPAHPDDQPDARMLIPLSAVWSPDGSTLLVNVWEKSPLPDEEPQVIDPSGENTRTSIRLIDVASGESVLLGHLPASPMGLYLGAWGPDNDVMIAGYYLKLEQK